jgi:4-diphosphocytidyl-2-C-methyl-D-erythritol kinase
VSVRGGSVDGVVVLSAPAKVTLSLRIVGVRPDGYHLIDAEMVSVDLADTLELTPAAPGGTTVEAIDAAPGEELGSAAGIEAERGGGGVGVSATPAGADNLVARALTAVGRSAAVRLHKRIPPGAGLGGGSSDAAAVLRWAGVTDPSVAVGIGADVPFCVVGGRAQVRGVGEVIEPLEHEPLELTLATPPFGCSTPAVYAAWDRLGGPTGAGPNDLEAAALVVEPRLARWRDALGEATGEEPVLAGSGSTWFVRGAHPGAGRVVVRSVPPGWRLAGTDG